MSSIETVKEKTPRTEEFCFGLIWNILKVVVKSKEKYFGATFGKNLRMNLKTFVKRSMNSELELHSRK
jgi:hypothetical protein